MDFFIINKILIITSLTSIFLLTNAVPSSRNIHIVHHDLRSDLQDLCQKTTNPILCAKTIQPFLGNSAVEPLKALDVEVDATFNQTKKTMDIIGDLLAKQDNPKSIKGSLDTCKQQYSSILDSIKETKDAIANHDVVTAKFKFSAVISFQQTCQDEFKKSNFPFADDSDAVFQLGGNCLDIIADIEKRSPPPTPTAAVQSAPSEFSDVIGTVS
ncbi:Pectinesterase inhibitor domain [Sesbania bispinosa]|nr:Pectinesterase inhibitor domain [Sesbania bispinosa]